MHDHPDFEPAPRRRFTLTSEERAKIDAFIRKKGVTLCPAAGLDELAQLHIQREREWAAVKLEKQSGVPPAGARKRGRPAKLSAEEKKTRKREREKRWQQENSEKRVAWV